MDFSFTDEQMLLADSLTECLKRNFTQEDFNKAYENEEFPMDAWKALADNGFLAIGAPEEFGGTPADLVTQTLVAYLINKYGGPLAGFYTLGMTTLRDLHEFGSDEHKKLIVEQYLKGGTPFALGMSEPNAGSDVAGLQTSYVHDGDNVIINGSKHYNTIANQVDYILLLAKDAAVENVYQAVTMFILPADTPGVEITTLPKLGGKNPLHICEIFLKDVVLPKSMILGAEHAGFKQSMKNFEIERIASVAGSLAVAENAFEDAAAYANQRVQYGRPIGENQLIQEKIFEMKMNVELMRSYLFRVAWMKDQDMDVRVDHALLKYFMVQTCQKVVDDAVQVLGGLGLVGNHRVMKYYCECRSSRIGAGSDQVMIFSTAPQILKQFK
ncbi:acyl-CoA dehydrogenase family protein [Eggerthella timonensis]|uniref:acyl-CoA dehydrogenase family protein n=1 Tax=Eggerthella timonensis TaxID=1871008 RepID=UPI000C76EB2E|nr:acyl-CoA dehydrogenase family protein [Eggerthella timonensis]